MAEAGDKVADRYLLQEPIGRGGMGVVWRAHDELLDRQVAVKCARPDDDRAALRLTNEARNAARLHHPHIVSVFDFVEESEVCWIVMEYVSGGSLADMVRDRGALTPEEAGSIGCQIATALAKSHAEGVVHGDVTPENVLITEEGVAKLTDFGISRALWSEATMTRTGGVRGKPPYLPPEVARGDAADRKSDVFSLGATLYAAIEGRSPYGEASHPMAYVARAIEGYIETPHRAGPLVDPLTALLNVEPKRRPAADQAARLLRRVVPSSSHLEHVEGTDEDPHDGDTLDRTPFTMRLLPPSVRGAWRRPSRRVVITATAVGTAATLIAWAALFGPWGGGHSDESGRSGKNGGSGAFGTGDSLSQAGRAGTVGDARTADPCKLLNAASLSRFGETVIDPDYGEIDRCDVLLHGESGDDIADVQLNFDADPPEPGGDVPTRRVGNVTVGAFQREGDECVRNIASADRKQIWIITERLDTPAPDPCQLGDAATDYAVSVLDRGQVPRRSAQSVASSLVSRHACRLLDGDELERIAGVRVKDRDPGFGDWRCEWADDSSDTGVELEFTRDNDFSPEGEERAEIAGKLSSVSPEEWDDDSCLVRMLHRSYRNSLGDDTVELMSLNVYGPKPTKKLCQTAKALAATAAKRLPSS
ncbi:MULTISPECIES: serine/threonine-protein kinase [Streptomyces]|uniref:non-specific serine/threonine protein kinase n=1 Tax=Streptomyces melanosporofaciens TaxID=67327 RepID=A0A1H5BFE2_STRMJ|nr:serine/threonine-protein kinase [Streptomyces melanosporofaciens]SED52978.1 Serine/threonine protein kinase [Streptomyces melanosporofaciens]